MREPQVWSLLCPIYLHLVGNSLPTDALMLPVPGYVIDAYGVITHPIVCVLTLVAVGRIEAMPSDSDLVHFAFFFYPSTLGLVLVCGHPAPMT